MNYTDYYDMKSHKKRLKECSYDSVYKEYMSSSEIQVVCFDNVKTGYLNSFDYSEEKAHSVDAFAEGVDKMYYLIEFKNGDIKNEKMAVKLKLRDSLLILCDICKCKISDTRKNIYFVLVYNDERSNLNFETKRLLYLSRMTGKSTTYMDLDKTEGFLFKKSIMISKEQFEKEIIPKLKSI